MTCKIKTRTDFFTDLLRDAKKHPIGWNAIIGRDYKQLATDYYLFHEQKGLYLLKEYQKNPYERIGVGGKIARHVDEEVLDTSTSFSKGFGIVTGDLKTILYHLRKGFSPEEILNAAITGKDLGMQFPLKGQASNSSEIYTDLQQEAKDNQKKISKHFEKKAADEGLYQSYD